MKYKKEIEYLEEVKRQLQLGQIIQPSMAEQYKKDEIMYGRIIKILESISDKKEAINEN